MLLYENFINILIRLNNLLLFIKNFRWINSIEILCMLVYIRNEGKQC